MNLLREGFAWLDGQRNESFATAITYRRGGPSGKSFSALATRGKTSELVTSETGSVIRSFLFDYKISAAYLILDDFPITPKSGDQIVEADGSVFEVTAIPGEGEWRWHGELDPVTGAGTTFRIHTKQVSAV